ncbi:MAG: GMC family oxidoreductase N-terminal domain-containing protein [Rhodocyclales bacterium]|nr:GMC family oxidoreductase N-terminal domain-containing protein [Rhodocyclales bacterium]
MEFDYIIVGGGAAGCVLAARLAKDGRYTVALLEWGRSDSSPILHIPGMLAHVMQSKDVMTLLSEPDSTVGGRRFPVPQGRVLGGGSSVNGMIYIRGHRDDYDDWSSEGATGWEYEKVLPVFKAQERNMSLSGPFHGTQGELIVANQEYGHPLCRAFIEAAAETGIPHSSDFNGAKQDGVGFYQLTAFRGRRRSAAHCFLYPMLGRETLTVETGVRVRKIRFSNRRAVAVEARDSSGKDLVYKARREILLCGGTFQSPKLLMQSGIGPAEHLRQHGIDVVYDSPDVGSNYHDHVAMLVAAKTKEPISLYGQDKGLRAVKHGLQYLLFRKGLLTTNVLEAGGFVDTNNNGRPDIQFHVGAFVPGTPGSAPRPYHGIALMPCVLQPKSRGFLRLSGSDPESNVVLEPNALGDSNDLATLRRGVQVAREILAGPSLRTLISEEVIPGTTSSDSLDEAIRANARTVYHPAGTCRMGSDREAVVDPSLRVRGVDGLRVVDCSVMPRLVSGNTNAPTMMIADRAASFVLQDT